MSKARIRHSIMTSLSKTNCPKRTGILRATHSALLVSLARYGLATVGTGAYEEDLRRLETRHANISARRVLGLGVAGRLEPLFAVADLMSTRNLYLRSCAAILDRALRAGNSSLKERMSCWLSRAYDLES